MALGVQHPDKLDLTWQQFRGWIRFYGQEPFGDERADLRSAIVARAIAGGSLRNYLPFYRVQPQTADEQRRIMERWLGK